MGGPVCNHNALSQQHLASPCSPCAQITTHILALVGVNLLAPADVLDTELENAQAKEAEEQRCSSESHVALCEQSRAIRIFVSRRAPGKRQKQYSAHFRDSRFVETIALGSPLKRDEMQEWSLATALTPAGDGRVDTFGTRVPSRTLTRQDRC